MARPLKEINWDIVEKKMEAGNSAKEIYTYLRLDKDTFYRRFKDEYNKSFGDYGDDFYSAGDGNLKFTQYIKALGGNINMLIWLGKVRLGQRGPEMTTNVAPMQGDIDKDHEIMRLKNEIVRLKASTEEGEKVG